MICSALVYILLTRLSDLTAPFPWTHHNSAKGFAVLQKQVLLHTNRQGVKTLCTVSLLLKAFSGGPSLPKVSLQRCCTPPLVVTVARPHYPLPLDTCSNWLCPPSHHTLLCTEYKRCSQRPQEPNKGFSSFLPSLLRCSFTSSPNSQGLRLPCRLSAHLPSWEKRGDIEHSYLTSSH